MEEEMEQQQVNGNGEEESPRDRFKRLATLRTNEVLKRLKILGHCANKRTYEYDQNDVLRMFNAIEASVRDTKEKFFNRNSRDFRL